MPYMPMVLPIEGPLSTYEECWRRCNATPGCRAWGISLPPGVPGGCQIPTLCYLKDAEPRRIPHVMHRCRPPAPGADALDDMANGLLRIARELASGPNAAGGRIRAPCPRPSIRFPTTASWRRWAIG